MEQLVARWAHNPKVGGSSPPPATQTVCIARCEPFLFFTAVTPAPGNRYANSGDPVNVGNGGFSYSSAVSGIYGLGLKFYSQYLNASSSDTRGFGFQLRCLSE